MLEVNGFNAVRISLASPEQIRNWSYGEVTVPETINYRTLKPERDGLFSERIFGPTKDFECYCGKYKRERYKGIVCDKCGVEVSRAKVRRERMGHIELAAPVAHIWFSKGIPSRLGLLMDLSPRSLERVLYFAQYIVTEVKEETRREAIDKLEKDVPNEIAERQRSLEEKNVEIRAAAEAESQNPAAAEEEISRLRQDFLESKAGLETAQRTQREELEDIQPGTLLTESQYRELVGKYGQAFEAGMGAEAVLKLLASMDMETLRQELLEEVRTTSGQRHKKASKRLRVVEAFRRSGNKPEWMILTVLPVLPPDLRPMVQLDGGRFATSDLNDLYRRVINRNNRLRRLQEMGAPEIIIRNEKRMLQEAVDALIDNGRRRKAVSIGGNHKLKSLSDMLRGKQGRFRQNLLGKRVDYSGRSVIVVGPELQLHQCGLPKRMALELFKPFIMRRLIEQGMAHNIKSARRLVDRAKPEVWDILTEVIKERPVMLNRAPTLHRLGIQAFEPVLIDGSAIQIHPLVCTAFNADFDGDQMAVHVPLSKAAVREAQEVMLSIYNMLLPSSGEPVVTPTLDMVLGCYYLTGMRPGAKGEDKRFGSFEEARLAYDLGAIDLQAQIHVRDVERGGQMLTTTVGRIIFNEVLPKDLPYFNEVADKAKLKSLVSECYEILGSQGTAPVLDNLKRLGFRFATQSGISIAANDIEVPASKPKILEEAGETVATIDHQYRRGLISEEERYDSIVKTWIDTTNRFTQVISQSLDRYGGIYMMATSGAKGNIDQIRQMAGMRGLMSDPAGRIIEFPIRASFREGLSVLEYFISTHGARKGLADTALRTSDSGYLTRRLIDVAQDVIILEEDCGTTTGVWVTEPEEKGLLPSLAERLVGRLAAAPLVDPNTGQTVVDLNQEIDEAKAKEIAAAGITQVYVRSPLTCLARQGICQHCYGRDLARRKPVAIGTAVGIIAAQSIGEPGTQLTMRTFHTGGVVGIDITSGLPRVEELFEARSPKRPAIISEIDGTVEVARSPEGRKVRITSQEEYRDEYLLPPGFKILVTKGQQVEVGTVLAQPAPAKKAAAPAPAPLVAKVAGRVERRRDRLFISYEEREVREYPVPASAHLLVEDGSIVRAGQQLTDGHANPQDILRVRGREAVQRYLVDEVQKVYRSQGVNINDKHIEVVVRQMLTKVRVESSGDTNLLPGELVERLTHEDVNAKVLAEGGEAATATPILLGITRASLSTQSWLAAASFQETTRTLTEAAISGKIDKLVGLKENVIIGKLIPAWALTIVKEEPEPDRLREAARRFLGGGEAASGGQPSLATEPVAAEDTSAAAEVSAAEDVSEASPKEG